MPSQVQKLTAQLDKLWSTAIHKRDGNRCRLCGSVTGCQAHHLLSRRYTGTRWELQNGILLCITHHNLAHAKPATWFRRIAENQILGTARYSQLQQQAYRLTPRTVEFMTVAKKKLQRFADKVS